MRIYLDDMRTPTEAGWIIARNFAEFKNKIELFGIENIQEISFDHDLADFTRIDGISNEWTGFDAAKWLVENYTNFEGTGYFDNPQNPFPKVNVHSNNPAGAKNIQTYLNNYLSFSGRLANCTLNVLPHIV